MSEIDLPEENSSLTKLFSNFEDQINISIIKISNETSSTSNECSKVKSDSIMDSSSIDDSDWKGIDLKEIYNNHGPFDWEHLPPIHPSHSHTVLFKLPLPKCGPPKAYPTELVDKWSENYVRMPYSTHSLYPVNSNDKSSSKFKHRWEVIQEALLQSFISCHQLEVAILSYNSKYAEIWKFTSLDHFFNEYVGEEEMKTYFKSLIPKIIQLALQLPDLITNPIPLLKRQTNKLITLSQLQVASLLANAFLCTFPRRNSSNPESEFGTFPQINFNRLFSSFSDKKLARCPSVMEKLKCIFHYFQRVTTKVPEGVITIQRRYIPRNKCPRWDKQNIKLPKFHITQKGSIENQGTGLLQVDFANKRVGGGVLKFGCVQEEIRFVICPELMVTMLVSETLDDTEAIIVNGVERYSDYEGYSNNFKWIGDFIDDTPRDSSGRRKTCIVAIDATPFKQQPIRQFNLGHVIRELNKAYVGFSSEMSSNNLPAVATGNWGCGAFRGKPQLKVLIQLMAAAVAGRSVVYFTFGDISLRDNIADMYWHLIQQQVDVGQLFGLISQFQELSVNKRLDFYSFLRDPNKYVNMNKNLLARKSSREKKEIQEQP